MAAVFPGGRMRPECPLHCLCWCAGPWPERQAARSARQWWCAAGKITVQKCAQLLRQGAAHGRIIDQNHCLPGQRVLHREAGVAESLYGEDCTFQLQHSGKAAGAGTAKAEQYAAQHGKHCTAAQQQPARRQRQIDAEICALHSGQQYGSAQQHVQQQIPHTQLYKIAQARHAVSRSYSSTAGEHLIKESCRPGQLRQQNAQRSCCRCRTARHQPQTAALPRTQKPCAQKQRCCGQKVRQQQFVQIDHGFHTRSLSNSSIFQFCKKTCRCVQKSGFCKNFETGFSQSITFFTFFSKKYLNISGKCGILLPS